MRTRERTAVDARMADVREAFRLRRLARGHRGLWNFYLEHNLFDDARDTRVRLIEILRQAREQWRRALGL
jgi:hypothetical protein